MDNIYKIFTEDGKVLDQTLFSYLISNLAEEQAKDILKSLYGIDGFCGGYIAAPVVGKNRFILTNKYNLVKVSAGYVIPVAGGCSSDEAVYIEFTNTHGTYEEFYSINGTKGVSVEGAHYVLHNNQFRREINAENISEFTVVSHCYDSEGINHVLSNFESIFATTVGNREICWFYEAGTRYVLKANINDTDDLSMLYSLVKELKEWHTGTDDQNMQGAE